MRSKYSSLNSSAPDSVAAPVSFGECSSMKSFLRPELAHRALGRRLHLEDQLAVGTAQVEVAPVDPLVERRIGRDRDLRLGQRVDLDLLELQLEPAQVHALVRLHRADERDGRLRRERRDPLVQLTRPIVLRQHRLGHARFVAQHDELHALLVAQRVDPATHPDALVDLQRQLGYQRAFHDAGPYPTALAEPRKRRIDWSTARAVISCVRG